jgi:hypothetical protein
MMSLSVRELNADRRMTMQNGMDWMDGFTLKKGIER